MSASDQVPAPARDGPPPGLVRSPFVASWVGLARPGETTDPDPLRRTAAWAQWAAERLVMIDNGERRYPAVGLDGRFYTTSGEAPLARPHLEIPRRVLGVPDAEFPARLAAAGAAMRFAWWVYPEVVALRRATFNRPPAPAGELLEALNARRASLVDGLSAAVAVAAEHWSTVERLLVSEPEALLGAAVGDFDVDDVAAYLPLATDWGLRVVFDGPLAERSGTWATRRVGVWQLRGTAPDGSEVAVAAVTPRLTANSQFYDQLFKAQAESVAALLVRALILRRLARTHLTPGEAPGGPVADPADDTDASGPRLWAVAARMGAKIPEASVAAAVSFLHAYPDGEAAWAALERWAEPGYLLTVAREGFLAAHRGASRAMRRAEEPDRDDINAVLPLAWSPDGKVVRVSFRDAPRR